MDIVGSAEDRQHAIVAGRAVIAALMMVGAAACVPVAPVPASGPAYQPPVIPGPYAELELVRHDGSRVSMPDPEVLRVGDRWYLYGTTSSVGYEAWSSNDLVTWDYEGMVWEPTAGSWNDRRDAPGTGYWAPNVVADGDGFLLYYTAHERIGVARADSPTGPFVDLLDHPLLGDGYGGVGDGVPWPFPDLFSVFNGDDVAIDAFHLRTSSGERYLYFSARSPELAAVIDVVRLDGDASVVPGSRRTVLGAEVLSWEGVVREAPWVQERGGRYWLTYSGSPYLTTCYAVGEAVSDSPTGPFVRVAPGPFLHDDPSIGFWGPGHHSFTTGPDGEQLIFFHTRQEPTIGEVPRQTRWAEVTHDADGRTRLVDPPGVVGRGRSSCWPFPL